MALAIALGLAALVACTGKNAVDQTSGGAFNFVTLGGDVKSVSPAKRGAALTLSGTSLKGNNLELAALRGRIVVLNFWASWCAPCRAETPLLSSASTDLAAKPVTFLGVDVRESKANGQTFIRKHHVPFDSFYDKTGELTARVGKLPPNGIPSTLLLDRQGRVALRFPRPVRYSEIVDAVNKLIAEPA